jgi:hypothetical protein
MDTPNKDILEKVSARIKDLSEEVQFLVQEREALSRREEEIKVRMDQIVGAIFELQKLQDDLVDQLPK